MSKNSFEVASIGSGDHASASGHPSILLVQSQDMLQKAEEVVTMSRLTREPLFTFAVGSHIISE